MLSSKVAIITGAARGIGLATTRLLLQNGARVSMVDVSEKVGRAACSDLQREFSNNEVTFMPCDVTKSEQLRGVFEQTKKRFGDIDIVCNNAGVGDESHWRKMIDINLVSVIDGTFLGLEYMSTQNGGRGGNIVNVASFGGIVAMPYGPVYCASKHGVVGFSRSLKVRATTDGVRVNCICPEFANTRMVTDGLLLASEDTKSMVLGVGLLSPEEVAEGILELITNTSHVGATMTITKRRGIGYWRFRDEEPPKAKL